MDKISIRVKEIRTQKRRSLHDCANLLGIPKETYHLFEEGNGVLSLPDLELLAIFFEIPAHSFFEESIDENLQFTLLQEKKKGIFTELRNKMISTTLAHERENHEINLEDLSQTTGIPLEVLVAYENHETAIPLEHLVPLCGHLNLPIKSLLFNPEKSEEPEKEHDNQGAWVPEFSIELPDNEEIPEDLYQQVILGMKSIPGKDQAELAKLLIEKLKNF